MLSTRNCPSALTIDFFSDRLVEFLAHIGTSHFRTICNSRNFVSMSCDQCTFAFVPGGQKFRRGRGADQARVRNSCKAHPRNVSRSCINAFEVPDGFGGSTTKLPGKKTTAIFKFEDASVSPRHFVEWSDIQNIHDKAVTRLCTFNCDWARQIVDTI